MVVRSASPLSGGISRPRPYAGQPAGFVGLIVPCDGVVLGAVIELASNGFTQWPNQYMDQMIFGFAADEDVTGDVVANVDGLSSIPVFEGDDQATTGAISLGDYCWLSYDGALGIDGGFHLLNWTKVALGGISLTTIGNSGPATLIGSVLNIPVYSSSSGGTTQIITTAAPVVVQPGDGMIILDKNAPSATAVSLPSVHTRNGLPLTINDYAGNGGDITLTPDIGETVMGLSTAVIGSNGQGIGTAGNVTLIPNTTLNTWLQA